MSASVVSSAGAGSMVNGAERMEGARWQTRRGAWLTVRHCAGHDELEACVRLQQETWGYEDLETSPRKTFLLAQELGGQVIGVFDDDGLLVGFAMAMAALEDGDAARPYLHSHMLAVRPGFRDHGLGARLKLVQREDALGRGLRRMTWTFDPLAGKNAYFNLHRLGAVVRRYSPDFYGVSSSRLQAGLPTDRLHAEWWLDSERVRQAAGGLASGLPDGMAPQATVTLPAELAGWVRALDEDGLERAREAQGLIRRVFQQYFAAGLAAVDFVDGSYTLAPWSEIQKSF